MDKDLLITGNIQELQAQVRTLTIRLRHMENEAEVTRQEYEARTLSYVATLAEVERKRDELDRNSSQLEKANKELKEATAQIVHSERLSALGQLSASVAHELNQPLNVIKIICQSAQRETDKGRYSKEAITRDLPDIVGQVGRMSGIIEHMRIFSRRTDGAAKTSHDINVVVDNALRFIEQQLIDHNIRLIREFDTSLPAVMCDPISIEQVLVNLINNARITLEDSRKENKSIEIRTCKVDGQGFVAVEVKDNTNGIPDEIRGQIFEPFLTSWPPGNKTGLGLSVAKKIIEEHRGALSVQSWDGIGSTFTFTLPVSGKE